jgi:threonine dehydrogenase-like Zn-dependent dehydrogenase
MQVRLLTAPRAHSGESAPAVVVDTTGDPDTIRSALDRVADGGTVVLAGETSGRTLDLDLYSTVHRRGLVVVGVASPAEAFESSPDVGEGELEAAREALGFLWYRLET